MTTRRAIAVLAGAALLGGCTTSSAGPGDAVAPGETAASTAAATATADTEMTPPPSSPPPTPVASPSPTADDVVFATGSVTADGTELSVSGDCDISREFGEEPVPSLDADDVDVLLAVDNLTGDGRHEGPFALQIRLLGGGGLVGRTVTSQGAQGEDGATLDVTYEGEIEVAELRDRRELEFVDVATLHLEATQQRVAGPGNGRRAAG